MLNDEHLKAFDDWKKALARTDVLTTPVFDGKMPFMIQADSSAHSVGACLAHEQPDGTERSIAFAKFASFKLTPLNAIGRLSNVRNMIIPGIPSFSHFENSKFMWSAFRY